MKLPPRLSIRNLRFGAAACGAVLLILSTPAFAQTLKATPQSVVVPVTEAIGKTTLSWDAGAANPTAEVWFKIDDGDEERFSNQPKGTQVAVILPGKTYTYKLYKDENGQEVLATVVVTGKAGGDAPAPAPADGDANNGAPPVPAPAPFTGTWPTVSGGTHEYTVRLQQVGERVTGSFSPGNGKIFDGTVTGRKLKFNWSQAPDFEGFGEFTLDEDGKGFKGSSTALKPQKFTNTWNSFIPEPVPFAGNWETVSNNTQFTLTLQQDGDKVTGIYTPGNGKIEGTLKGRILRFTWTSDSGNGSGRWVMSKDEMTFSGSYSDTEDPEQADGTWTGTRKIGGGGGKTTGGSGGKNPPKQ